MRDGHASLPHPSKEISSTTADPHIASPSDVHHPRSDTGTGDPALPTVTAATQHLLARMTIAAAWGNENLDSDMQPKVGAASYRIDTFIRFLVDRHQLSALPGESDLSLTLRALATEFGQIAHRAKAAALATEMTAAGPNPHPRTQP